MNYNNNFYEKKSKSRVKLWVTRVVKGIIITITIPVLFVPPLLFVIRVLGIRLPSDFLGTSFSAVDILPWGYFGEFWWNSIIAIASVINVYVFILISRTASKMQEDLSSQTNKNQIQLTFAHFKFDLVRELKTMVHNCDLTKEEKRNNFNNYLQFHIRLISFGETYLQKIFNLEIHTKEFHELRKQLDHMRNTKIDENDIGEFVVKADEFICFLVNNIRRDMGIEDNAANT